MKKTDFAPRLPLRQVAAIGLAAGLCAVLQAAAGVLPGIGHVLSMLPTFPIALLTMASPGAGAACLAVAAATVFTVFPEESPILVFMTGPLGIALGLAGSLNVSVVAQSCIGAVTLTLGMAALSLIVGIDPLGGGLASLGLLRTLGVHLVFSFVYSLLWITALKRTAPRLLRLLNRLS
ncbi:MAG: hypothetical protein BWY85_01982 [Firmicutes bacterium ADurb.Bin506]|nr:MAG: hypothetical protein BWY85_01982 [Firmicutes bacterium ADurb.Bin506]